MAQSKAAVIGGTFIRPGISKNNRLYTSEAIGKAVVRMQEQLKSPKGLLITMAPSHGKAYEDNALDTVGRVTKVWQEKDGSAKWTADIANTTQGRDIATLAHGKFIRPVSIRGGWMEKPTVSEDENGREITTASDMSIVGIDFTHRPGVEGAEVDYVKLFESFDGSTPIEGFCESTDEIQLIKPFNEELPDEEGRIREAVETAVKSILEAKNKDPYEEIKESAKKLGIKSSKDFDSFVGEMKNVLESSASMYIYNGAGSVSVNGNTDDDKKLAAVALRVAASAIIALNSLDPDADGDIDLPGGGSSDSDTESTSSDSACILCDGDLSEGNMYCPTCGAPVPQVESDDSASTQTKEVVEMTTENKTAEEVVAEAKPVEATAAAPVSAEDIAKLVSEGITSALAAAKATEVAEAAAKAAADKVFEEAVAAKVAELTGAKTEETEEKTEETKVLTEDQKIEAAVEKALAAIGTKAVADYRNGDSQGRKGLVGGSYTVKEDEIPDSKVLAELNNSDFHRVSGEIWSRSPAMKAIFDRADANAGSNY
jgi:hypothetical protein